MKHLVDKTILVPFREELKYAVCIVSGRRSPAFRQGGRRSPAFRQGKHRVRLYASRSSGQKPGPTLGGPRAERQREENTAHVWPCEPLCTLFQRIVAARIAPIPGIVINVVSNCWSNAPICTSNASHFLAACGSAPALKGSVSSKLLRSLQCQNCSGPTLSSPGLSIPPSGHYCLSKGSLSAWRDWHWQ